MSTEIPKGFSSFGESNANDMTARDVLAGKSLPAAESIRAAYWANDGSGEGLVVPTQTRERLEGCNTADQLAILAYMIADAMLKERERR